MNPRIIAGILLPCCAIAWFFQPRPRPIETYGDAKHALENDIIQDHRETLYCGATFDRHKNIIPPPGFVAGSHKNRSRRMEWEHVVPAENFGRAFVEWREGDPLCVSHGKPYKGRRCAEKASAEYRRMERDMYNLYPAIGSVNAARGNRQYAELPDVTPKLETCGAKIEGSRFEPPDRAKGRVARASLYMAAQYPACKLSARQKKLFEAWDRLFPVDKWECARTKRIEKIQGNENIFVKKPCRAARLW